MVDAATCKIPRRVEVTRLSKQPAFRASNTRNLVRSICPEKEVTNCKMTRQGELVQGYLLHRGVGFKGNALTGVPGQEHLQC